MSEERKTAVTCFGSWGNYPDCELCPDDVLCFNKSLEKNSEKQTKEKLREEKFDIIEELDKPVRMPPISEFKMILIPPERLKELEDKEEKLRKIEGYADSLIGTDREINIDWRIMVAIGNQLKYLLRGKEEEP